METRYKPFTQEVINAIRAIPPGRVATYGGIAKACGNPNGARQVVRILSTLSQKENLPWHRVVNRKGEIAIKGDGTFEQILRLRGEGVTFTTENCVDLEQFVHKF